MEDETPKQASGALVAEFLDCARYGELEELKGLVSVEGVVADCCNEDGTTALHRAAANGHLDIVEYLLHECLVDIGVLNLHGNSALHWAVMGKQIEMVNYLLKFAKGKLYATQKNKLGKSALMMAFDNCSEEMQIALLSQNSVCGSHIDKDENAEGNSDVPKSTDFAFSMASGVLVRCSEGPGLTFDNHCDDVDSSTTGDTIWSSSLIASRWVAKLASEEKFFVGKRTLELGSGCGIVGLTAALVTNNEFVLQSENGRCAGDCKTASSETEVMISDADDVVMANLEKNLIRNININGDAAKSPDGICRGKVMTEKREVKDTLVRGRSSKDGLRLKLSPSDLCVELKYLDWSDEATWPLRSERYVEDNGNAENENAENGNTENENAENENAENENRENRNASFDVILGSDLIFEELPSSESSTAPSILHHPLTVCVNSLLSQNGVLLYVYQQDTLGVENFIQRLSELGFKCDVRLCPESFKANIVPTFSDKQFRNAFPQLESSEFFLLKAWRQNS